MPAKKSPRPHLESRIRVRMAESGIRSVAALKRQLSKCGVTISDAQLGRLVDGKVEHVSMPVLEGLLGIFGCQLGDLYAPA